MSEVINYFVLVALILMTRTMDLISTYHATPKLELELNQWMRRVGWRVTIFINIGVAFLVPLIFNRSGSVVLATFSALLAWRNFQLAPLSRTLGQSRYREQIDLYYRQTNGLAFWTPVAIKMIIFMLFGLLVMGVVVVDREKRLWFLESIGRAFVFYALFIAGMEISMRVAARRRGYAGVTTPSSSGS